MWLRKKFQSWLGRRPARRCPKRRSSPPRDSKLALEPLEDRTVPSSFTASSVADLLADINAANLAGGSNTITLKSGHNFKLTGVDNTTDGANGLPVIAANDNLTIIGNGDTIMRSAAAGTPAFRLLDVAVGTSLTLQNLTLQGGLADGLRGPAAGGAIYNKGSLDLNGVTVKGNIAQGRDGITSRNSDGGYAEGGGIWSNFGALTLEGGTKVHGNKALGGQGAGAGWAWIVSGRDKEYGPVPPGHGGSGSGGGLYVAGGAVTITNAIIADNLAQGGAGGKGGSKNSKNPTWSWFIDGAAGGSGYGGGLCVARGDVTFSSSIISRNKTQGGTGGDSSGGTSGTGGSALGAGIYLGNGTVTLDKDKVTGNHALGGVGGLHDGSRGVSGSSQGGGLNISTYASAALDDFTVANIINNTAEIDADIHGLFTPSP